jgi:predicted ATPase/DNA-binding SARP family transcriptional activator/tetratricopeptide (TPR) repeat protein
VIELVLLSRVAFRDREVTGPRIRALLALLADDLRAGCGSARLVDGIWPDEQPENPTKALQVVVSRARSQLGAEVIVSTPTGYRLALGEDQVDAAAVLVVAARSARDARAGDHDASLAHADVGLALFTGADPGAAVLDDPLAALRADRAGTRRSLWRSRVLALARLGRHAEAVEPLTDLVAERPRDEDLLLELLRCEAATAGPATALAGYDRYRRALRDELGTDPGPALRELHQQLLDGAAPVRRHHVPHEPNPLLGRESDLAEVAKLLRTARVTSIVGPGGLGKTRLAQTVSRHAELRTVHFVPLAGVASGADVAPDVAAAVGAAEPKRAGAPRAALNEVETIVNAVGHGPALLVLDNCEHVVAAVAELVTALVARTKELRILTTSRTPLAVSAESVYLLPQLPLATAVELFEQRARAARPGVELPAAAVADLCRHLDGLPLAVELAAARVRVLAVPEIAERLSDRFALLRGGARDAPERHRTLHAVVDWSWNLLDERARAAMRALSLFPGGFALAAAERMLGPDAVDVLADLVDQSLLTVTDTGTGTRYAMLETVREYGAARRADAGETDKVLADFLAWARDLGIADHERVFGPEPFTVVTRIRAEQDNLLLALRHAVERADGATVAAVGAVLGAMWSFEANYVRVAALTEQTSWLLSHYRPEPELVEATRAVCAMCVVNTFIAQGPRAMRVLVTLRRLPPAPPDTLARALGWVVGEFPEFSEGDVSRLLELCESDAPLVAGIANFVASYLWENDRDRDRALAAAERMLAALAGAASPWLPMMARSRLAELYLQAGRGGEAVGHIEIAVRHMESLGMGPDGVGLRWGLVMAHLQLGRYDEAERAVEIAMADTALLEDSWNIQTTFGLGARAEIHLGRGEVEHGLRLLRRARDVLHTGAGTADIFTFGVEAWRMEVDGVTVVAHVRHGRADLVTDLVAAMADEVTDLLAQPPANVPPSFQLFPLCGVLLLALGVSDVDSGAAGTGVALIALADEFRCLRNFHPTMSARWSRELAENADKPAYDDAVSSYAGLDVDELRAAALAVLRARS